VGGSDAGVHGLELVEPGEPDEPIGLQCVEADRDPSQPRGLERIDLIGEQDAVGREREVLEPGFCAIMRTRAGTSRRSSGSPPVSRTLSTPSDRNTSTSALISSNRSTSSRGSQT
jgi:hypothetical protein